MRCVVVVVVVVVAGVVVLSFRRYCCCTRDPAQAAPNTMQSISKLCDSNAEVRKRTLTSTELHLAQGHTASSEERCSIVNKNTKK